MTNAVSGEVQERGDDGRWRTVRLGEVRVTDRRRVGRTFEADSVTINGVDVSTYMVDVTFSP